MKVELNKAEYLVITGVLEKMGAADMTNFEGEDIFRFTKSSCKDFLTELPKVVSILAEHKNDIRYKKFIDSTTSVVDILSEINLWRFCLDTLDDLSQMLYETRCKLEEGGSNG